MTGRPGVKVAWFRRDLRLHDNPMLLEATRGERLGALFVLDDRLLTGRRSSPNRNWYLRACLEVLREGLRARGGELVIRRGTPEKVVPAFARDIGAEAVCASRDYTPFARRRDAAVAASLEADGIRFETVPGTLAQEPDEVLQAGGAPYSVFTPFYKRWLQLPLREPLEAPRRLDGAEGVDPGELPPAGDQRFHPAAESFMEPGESAALERLQRWVDGGLAAYTNMRDRLDLDGTSRLGQDLHFGTLSPVQVIAAARASAIEGAKFVSEVAWREFYHHVLWHHPRVLNEPFQERYRDVAWRTGSADFDAWKAGLTGYPVVDAAMRELRATGYMHNRARMIAASFLTKDLLIDWRRGEEHFLRHLVDGDIANNNGGWQWAASVGTDAQPFFRVFNPVLQGRRFDPAGVYVRRWLPELAGVADKYVHEPWTMPAVEQARANCRIGIDYPAPVVDHAEARKRAIEAFRVA